MIISDALAGVRLLYVETAPFIYFTEKRALYVDKMRAIFQYLDDGLFDVAASTIAFSEALTKPLKDEDTALVRAYSEMFGTTSGLRMIPVDMPIARQSAVLRARYNLKTPDALHIATVIITHCDAFLTNDLDLKRVTEIRMIVLEELELDPPQKRES